MKKLNSDYGNLNLDFAGGTKPQSQLMVFVKLIYILLNHCTLLFDYVNTVLVNPAFFVDFADVVGVHYFSDLLIGRML